MRSCVTFFFNLFVTSLFLLSIGASGQGVRFSNISWPEAISLAKKENKLIFLDAYASWCGPCKWMDRNVFPAEEVGRLYNANFINLRIDMEKGVGIDLAKKYGVRAFPTYLFINDDGEV